MALVPYTLEQAETDIAALRGLIDVLNEAHSVNDITAGQVPNAPAASGHISFSAAGQSKYLGFDGNAYNTGCISLFTTSPTTVNSTSAFTLLSLPVEAGLSYRFDGIVRGTQGPNAIGQFVRFAGPAASFGIMYIRSNASANTSVTDSELGTGFPVDHTTPAWGAAVRFWVRFRGVYTFSAGGTFSLQARANSAVNTWTAEAGAMMDVRPST